MLLVSQGIEHQLRFVVEPDGEPVPTDGDSRKSHHWWSNQAVPVTGVTSPRTSTIPETSIRVRE